MVTVELLTAEWAGKLTVEAVEPVDGYMDRLTPIVLTIGEREVNGWINQHSIFVQCSDGIVALHLTDDINEMYEETMIEYYGKATDGKDMPITYNDINVKLAEDISAVAGVAFAIAPRD